MPNGPCLQRPTFGIHENQHPALAALNGLAKPFDPIPDLREKKYMGQIAGQDPENTTARRVSSAMSPLHGSSLAGPDDQSNANGPDGPYCNTLGRMRIGFTGKASRTTPTPVAGSVSRGVLPVATWALNSCHAPARKSSLSALR